MKKNRFVIPAEGVRFQSSSPILNIIAAISTYICILPLIIMDAFLWQFQNIYFRIYDIPILKRSHYIILDRYKLGKLNFGQRLNCFYCEYANGLVAFAKAVVNQMELYSCAIKHTHMPPGQEHQKAFFEREKFE